MDRIRASSLRLVALLPLALTAAACGDYGGESTSGPELGGTADAATAEESVEAFSATVFPMVRQHCDDCHAGAGPGSPHIAHSDPGTAHANVTGQQKVNLAVPSSSRLVQRLVTDSHFCWENCVSDAALMQAAIEQWASLVDYDGGGVSVEGALASEPLAWSDGVEDEGAERYAENVIALYEFREGEGDTARDTSGVEPAADLSVRGPEWMSGYGIQIEEGSAMAAAGSSRKLYDHIASPETGTGQYSVEVWMAAADVDQEGPARIVSYSLDRSRRNFTLGQVLYNFDFRNRSVAEEVDENGQPALQTYDVDRDLEARLQHVVLTYDRYRGRRIYVDGVFTDDLDEQAPAPLWNWDPEHRLVLGNEVNRGRQWKGQIRLVAIYKQALTESQILRNFNAGVGKRVLMRFDVSRWAGAGSGVDFAVSELDDFSYLFCEPTFNGPGAGVSRVANVRVAVNGEVPVSGQAFRTLDRPVSSGKERLSRQCSVVPKGPGGTASDEFSLVFEWLGSFNDPVVEADPGAPPDPPTPDPVPGEGIRDFARLSETMAAVTGVSAGEPSIRATYLELVQQLPSTYDLRSFVSSHQVAIAKLALEYCDVLVESPANRVDFFGASVDFDAPATQFAGVAGEANRDRVIQALADGMLGRGLESQPDRDEAEEALDPLFDALTAGCDAASCPAERTRTVVKGACAAVLSSAGVSVH